MTLDVSFVIIAYNEAGGIAATIDSILAQEDLGDFEVVVVDDASKDGTAGIVRRVADDRSEVRLVALAVNGGRGNARATGIGEATGALIATVDADIVLPPAWLRTCRAVLVERGADAVGGTAVPDGDVAYLRRRFGLRPKVVSATTTVTGNNGLYRREVFDRVSFDPKLREGEDVALNHALAAASSPTVLVPGLVVEHNETKSFATSVRWLHQSGRGASRQLRRYRRVRLPDVVFGAFAGTVALAGARGRRHPALLLLPLAVTVASSAGHVATRFHVGRRPGRALLAVLADAVLLLAYFTGRASGLVSRSDR